MRHILYDTAVCLTQISIIRFYVSEINAQVVCACARAASSFLTSLSGSSYLFRYQSVPRKRTSLCSLKVECRPPVPNVMDFILGNQSKNAFFELEKDWDKIS
jgi:hypothetical protein